MLLFKQSHPANFILNWTEKEKSVNEKDLATEICPLTLCSGVYVFNMYVCVCVPNTLGSIIATLNLLFTFGLEDSVFPHIK